ncbi:MAG: transposase family protein, partial [Gammaproteobacteria bacterium]|nr:transposase family protein [Gammaproteobacteria bacterium]
LLVELQNESPADFHRFMRMPQAMYQEIVTRLTPRLQKQTTNWRQPLEPGLKIAITLRHLASGSKYSDMQYGWRVPHNTISIVVREVCQAILDEYKDEMMSPPTTEQEWKTLADEWYERWQFPHTIGAIDGKHIACKCPPNTGSEYYNYKGFFSIILFAMVSSDYKFVWADTSAKGSNSDAQVYNASELKQGLENDDIQGWPRPDPLPNDTKDVPYFIIGDDAFALRTYLMKPFGHRNMSKEERIYNYRLSRARRVVENAFGILANRFQVILTTMQHNAETVELIVRTCLVLHNFMRTQFPVLQNCYLDHPGPDGTTRPGQWRQDKDLTDTEYQNVVAGSRASKKGKIQRNLLKHWCNSPAGSVPWQDDMI